MKQYSLIVVLFIVALARLLFTQNDYPDGVLLRIDSKISSEPTQYDNSQGINIEGFRVYLPSYPELNYGDSIVVEGVVEGSKLSSAKLIEHKANSDLLYFLRNKMNMLFAKYLPSPHSSLASGFVLGSKSLISTDFWEALKKTGTAHVVVASGMNVTLVGGFMMSMFIKAVDRRKGIVFTLIAVWLYAVLAGFEAPIVRASIMASIAFTSEFFGRLNSALKSLILSALIMIVVWPRIVFDVGFLLSFTATLSLMIFNKRVEKLLKIFPKIIRSDVATSLSAQIGVAPILFVTFGTFNILSPIINGLVLWTIVPITIISAISGIVGIFFEPVGNILIYIAYPLMSYFIWVIEMFS